MRVWVLGSGSSGNGSIVEADGHRLLIDAGIGPRTAVARMRALGGDLFPQGVSGIVVTHHHGDHVAKLEPLARALRAPLFLHAGIVVPRARLRYEVRPYTPGVPFEVGPFTVDSIRVPHDAPQVALRVATATRAFGIATDLGHVPLGLAELLGGCDAALLEANHCPDLLATGPYPPALRARVAGDYGHLANEQAAALAAELAGTRLATLYLGHLSKVNNAPERALAAVTSKARGFAVEVVPHGVPRILEISAGAARKSPRGEQLGLAFGAPS